MSSKKRSYAASSSSSSSTGDRQKSRRFTRTGTMIFNPSSFSGGRPAPYYSQRRGGETKYFDCGFSVAILAAGTTWADTEVPCDNYVNSSGSPAAYTDSCLIPTAIGSGYGQVDGNSYLLKKIRVRGRIQRGAAATDQNDILQPMFIRALLVMDTMPNGSQAQGEDVIQDFGELAENCFAFQRVAATAGKFRVLKDETWELPVVAAVTDGTNTSSQNTASAVINWKWQPRTPLRVNVKAGSATPTIASTINCNLFMLIYAFQNNSIVQVTFAGCSRAYYVD